MQGTIRENITFGQTFKEEKYWNAIKYACLDEDLDNIYDGDMTIIGEKGETISGG